MAWTKVDSDVAMEVASHEALVRQTYVDSVGVRTWCVGMTSATGHDVDRYIDKPASLQHCMNLYVWALDRYADGVREAFRGVELTKAQFTAALSFHWNTGAIGRATWVRHFRAGRMEAAQRAFMSWIKPPEIAGRRRKERDLLFHGKWSSNGTMLEYTRVTSRMTPDWKSGKRISVAEELKKAFDSTPPAKAPLDHAPIPDKKPLTPTLSPVTPEESDSILKRGSRGPFVQELQENLRLLGHPSLKVDGVYGEGTEAAVQAFQKKAGLNPDGWAGPRTLEAVGRAVERLETEPRLREAEAKVPETVPDAVKKETNLWQKITGVLGSGGIGLSAILGVEWQTLAVLIGGVLVLILAIVIFRSRLIATYKEMNEGLRP